MLPGQRRNQWNDRIIAGKYGERAIFHPIFKTTGISDSLQWQKSREQLTTRPKVSAKISEKGTDMLTIDELSIIKLYFDKYHDRQPVINALKEALPYVEDEGTKTAVTSVIRKITAMSDAAFANIDLSDTLVAE